MVLSPTEKTMEILFMPGKNRTPPPAVSGPAIHLKLDASGKVVELIDFFALVNLLGDAGEKEQCSFSHDTLAEIGAIMGLKKEVILDHMRANLPKSSDVMYKASKVVVRLECMEEAPQEGSGESGDDDDSGSDFPDDGSEMDVKISAPVVREGRLFHLFSTNFGTRRLSEPARLSASKQACTS